MVQWGEVTHGGAMTDHQTPPDPRFAHLPPPPPRADAWWATPPPTPPAGAGRPAATHRVELDVRNLVLALGVLSLVAAAVSFIAVHWDSFDAVVRAAIVVSATVIVLSSVELTRARKLAGTSAALGWLAMVLIFVDLVAVRRAAFAPVSADSYTAVGGAAAFVVFCCLVRWDRGAAMRTGAALAWLLGWYGALATWGVTGPDVWVLPLAAVVGWLQWTLSAKNARASSWERYGAALVIAAVPAVATTLADPGSLRPILVIAIAASIVLIGMRLRHLAAVWVAGVTLGMLVSAQVIDVVKGFPGWVILTLVGVALLGVGGMFEYRLRGNGVITDETESEAIPNVPVGRTGDWSGSYYDTNGR